MSADAGDSRVCGTSVAALERSDNVVRRCDHAFAFGSNLATRMLDPRDVGSSRPLILLFASYRSTVAQVRAVS